MAARGDLRRYVRWVAVLDALERDLKQAESLIDQDAARQTFDPDPMSRALPTLEDLGPLPRALAERAAALAQRQTAVLSRGQDRAVAMRRQIRLNQELRVEGDPVPVYLDTTG